MMQALLEGRDRLSADPMTPGMIVKSPRPVLANESELVAQEHRDRFWRLNRENAKMRNILDKVRELVELAWERVIVHVLRWSLRLASTSHDPECICRAWKQGSLCPPTRYC